MVLEVTNLSVRAETRRLLDEVNLTVPAGVVVAVVGASGAGKTTLGYAAVGEPRSGVHPTGSVRLAGRELIGATAGQLRSARSGVVGHLAQQPAAILDPLRRCGGVLTELAGLRYRRRTDRAAAARSALKVAGLTDPGYPRSYPHQLSGGQQQRMALATSLVREPQLLVLDEPTTGLDAVLRSGWLDRIGRLVADGTAVLLLTHDLPTVRALASEVLLLEAGRVVDRGSADAVLSEPSTPIGTPSVAPVVDSTDGLATRPAMWPAGEQDASEGGSETRTGPVIAAARELSVRLGRDREVVSGIDLEFAEGSQTLIVGASGAGKTTFGRALAGLVVPRGGAVEVDGVRLPAAISDRSREQRRAVQYVHQDVRAAFEEYTQVLEQVAATARRLRGLTRARARAEALEVTAALRVSATEVARVPGRLSGGQLQRCALARAMLARPRLLVCDEVTSALDEESRYAALHLLGEIVKRDGSAIVLIGHDLASLLPAADRVAVFDQGRCVECATAEAFGAAPATAELARAVAGS